MSREWSNTKFNEAFHRYIVGGVFNEVVDYYPRYRARYSTLLRRYCDHAPTQQQTVLDIGGGQLALLCKELWNDNAYVADIGGPHLAYLESRGVDVAIWNLCSAQQPYEEKFDFIFFSEVIEHLPIPPHIVLERLRKALKPGGTIICTTPNLYRLRNIVYMILGKRIFDYFRMPEDSGLGHVIEYSIDHLRWQFTKAGFTIKESEYCQIHHSPTNVIFRAMYWVGSPLFIVPRLRDNLFVLATNTKSPK